MFQCNICGQFVSSAKGLKIHKTRKHPELKISQTLPKSIDTSVIINNPQDSKETDSSETSSPDTRDLEKFFREIFNLKSRTKIIRRIPKAARSTAAASLATIIDLCVTENSILAWKRLIRFASACFSVSPASSDKNKTNNGSLTTIINRQVQQFEQNTISFETQVSSLPAQLPKSNKRVSCDPPVKLIESKIADGDVTGAVRILSSEMTLAPFDANTFEALKEIHPQGEPQCIRPNDIPQKETNLMGSSWQVSTESVQAAIASFPPGSSAGPDMLKPQHLKDLTSHSAGASGQRLLVSLVNLSTHMLRGKIPEVICPFLYGASLCALSKKDGGIRPIAVGNTFRRLVAKLGCTYAMPILSEYFKPTQFGFGTKGGAEAVAHAARRYVSFPHTSPKVFLKLDFRNAFNSIHRSIILKEASNYIPELGPFLSQCYGQSSHLSFGPHIISSSGGIQQGDPLGPALFCLAVQPLAECLTTELNLWYLDDSSLAGPEESVLQNLKTIITKSAEIGLELNTSKCELFFINVPESECAIYQASFSSEAPGIRCPNHDDFTLLGAPLKETALSKVMMNKTKDLQRLTERLTHISAHYAFYILKNCLAIPKLIYILRCAPTWKDPASLDLFDSTLLSTLEKITNITFSSQARAQSTLPIAEGGLGMRRASNLAVPAFLASASSVSSLLTSMLPTEVRNAADTTLDEALGEWISLTGQEPPPLDLRGKQSQWEKGYFELAKKDLQQCATTLLDKARLLGVASKASGAFLNVIPSPPLGTFLQDQVFRIAVSLRLGIQICQPHQCHCGFQVDQTGLHGLSCKKNPGRASRHAMANDVIRRGLVSAGYPVTLEPSFISPDTNKRPDGVTLSPWERGRSMAWDFTCVNSQATSYLLGSAGVPLYAATNAETKKKDKYAFLQNNFLFAPIAAECLGSFGTESLKTLKSIGQRIREATGERRAEEYFFQRLSVAIQKGNAMAIMGSIPRDVSLDENICMLR